MHIGAQLYTLRDFTQTPEDLARTLQKVAEIGYRYVHCSAIGPIDPSQLRDLLAQNGLVCTVTHTRPDRILNETEAVIAEHRIFGCNDIGMGMMPDRYRGSAEGLRALIADYAPAVRRIIDAGMRFHYHNHDVEFQRAEGHTLLDIMMEEWPEAHLLMCAFWVQAGGGDPIELLRKYGPRMRQAHLKDMTYSPQADANGSHRRMAPVLEGNMNYRGIVAACAEQGLEYLHVEQDDCNGLDPFECMRVSYNNLKTLTRPNGNAEAVSVR